VEKQVFVVARLDEPEAPVRQLFDAAFGHLCVSRSVHRLKEVCPVTVPLRKWDGVSAVLRLAWEWLLAPGLLNVGRQLRYIFCELCKTSAGVLLVHLLHGSLHVAVLKEKLVRRPCPFQQFRRPVFREHRGCPEQLATDDELFLRGG